MLSYYYPQGKQRCIDGLMETDSYKIWEVHIRPQRGARRGFATTERVWEVYVRPRRGARRGFGRCTSGHGEVLGEGLGGARQATERCSERVWEVHVRPRRGARRGFATTERALLVCVSA